MAILLYTTAMKAFRTLRSLFGSYRTNLAILVVLGTVGALMEGVGINAIIPLFSFLVGGNSGVSDDFVTASVKNLFS